MHGCSQFERSSTGYSGDVSVAIHLQAGPWKSELCGWQYSQRLLNMQVRMLVRVHTVTDVLPMLRLFYRIHLVTIAELERQSRCHDVH